MLSGGGILILKHTNLAVGAGVAFNTGAFVGVHFINARSSVRARMTVAFVDVCYKTAIRRSIEYSLTHHYYNLSQLLSTISRA